jgi:hypothetical protein
MFSHHESHFYVGPLAGRVGLVGPVGPGLISSMCSKRFYIVKATSMLDLLLDELDLLDLLDLGLSAQYVPILFCRESHLYVGPLAGLVGPAGHVGPGLISSRCSKCILS